MFLKNSAAALLLLTVVITGGLAACGSPYYVEGQDELGNVPDSLRVLIDDGKSNRQESRRQDEGVSVRDLESGVDTVPLPLEYASEGPYLLRRGDKVQIDVLFYPELETLSVVRPDGMITAPGVGDVPALGRKPVEVAADVEAYYSTLLRDPTTTLNVVTFGERNAYVLGMVNKPGPVDLQQRTSLTQALARVGSVAQDAKLGTVILLRRKTENTAQAYRLDLRGVLDGKSLAADIILQPDDVIWIPRTFIADMEHFVHQVFDGLIPIPELFVRTYDAIHVDERAALRNNNPGNTTIISP
jgi:protein involved in polysaccharide export with SLBB domain